MALTGDQIAGGGRGQKAWKSSELAGRMLGISACSKRVHSLKTAPPHTHTHAHRTAKAAIATHGTHCKGGEARAELMALLRAMGAIQRGGHGYPISRPPLPGFLFVNRVRGEKEEEEMG